MRIGRSGVIVRYLILALGVWLGLNSLAFASDALLAIPPFKGSTQYPALLSGLQQMIIDDLRVDNKGQVLSRLEVQTSLKRLGRPAHTPVYVREISKLQGALRAKWILINTFDEQEGFVDWRLQLVNRDTASVVQEWTFSGPLSNVFRLKQDILSALQQTLSLSTKRSAAPSSSSQIEKTLSALMAYGQGLEAFDDYQYTEATTQFHAALDHNKSFHYPKRQLNLVRSAMEDNVTSPRELGLFWLADGNAQKAKGYLQKALNQNAQDVDVLLALNRLEANRNRLRAARKWATKAQAIAGNQPQPWIELGKVAQSENKPRKALQMFQKALSQGPQNADVQHRIAELYRQTKQPAKAAQAYQAAGTLYGKTLQIKQASKAISKAKRITPKDVDVRLAEGDLFKHVGQPQKAQAAYREARRLAPKKAAPLQKLAKLQTDLGKQEAAFKTLERALAIDSSHVDANVQMAQLHLENGEYEQATVFLKRANPTGVANTAIDKALGTAYTGTGQLDAAATAFSSALQAAPDDASLHAAYASVLTQQGKLPEAQLQYEQALKLNPDDASAYKHLGIVQQQQGRVAEAKFAYTQASRIAPKMELPAIQPPDVQEGLLQLSSSFPEIKVDDHATTVALVNSASLHTGNPLHSILALLSDYTHVYRADTHNVFEDFKKSLQQTYVLTPDQQVRTTLAAAPFHVMTLDDLSNSTFLVALCEALKVDALMFYRIIPQAQTNDTYPFKITALLFEKASESRWVNDITLSYPTDQVKRLNLPLVIGLALISSLLLVGTIVYLYRGSGTLKVIIEQDEHKKKAIFSVIISKKANKDLTKIKSKLIKKADKKTHTYKYERKAKFAQKYERYLVLSESLFEKLHAGHYYVYLYGIIPDGRGGQMGNYQTTQQVTIQKNRTQETVFDFRTTTRQVDIQVFDGAEAAIGAEVSIKEQGESKYLKDPTGMSFHLPKGTFTIIIHHNDGLFTEEIEIPSLTKDYHFTIDLPVAPAAPASNRATIPPPIQVSH